MPAMREMAAKSTGARAGEVLERPLEQQCLPPRKLAAGAGSSAGFFPSIGNELVSPAIDSLERSAGGAAVVPPKTPQHGQNGETGTARVPLVRNRLPDLR